MDDAAKIRSTIIPWRNAVLNRDWDALIAMCTDDFVFSPPGEPIEPWRMTMPAKYLHAFLRYALPLILLLLSGCSSDRTGALAPGEREGIVQEIHKTLGDYKNAVMRKDLDAMQSFWSDSKEFVFAGDGIILGGHKEWSELMIQNDRDAEKWNYWVYRNIHVEVLAKDAASATLEFECSRQVKGKPEDIKGAWTYVFKKYGDRWRVIQTNGTHKGSYQTHR